MFQTSRLHGSVSCSSDAASARSSSSVVSMSDGEAGNFRPITSGYGGSGRKPSYTPEPQSPQTPQGLQYQQPPQSPQTPQTPQFPQGLQYQQPPRSPQGLQYQPAPRSPQGLQYPPSPQSTHLNNGHPRPNNGHSQGHGGGPAQYNNPAGLYTNGDRSLPSKMGGLSLSTTHSVMDERSWRGAARRCCDDDLLPVESHVDVWLPRGSFLPPVVGICLLLKAFCSGSASSGRLRHRDLIGDTRGHKRTTEQPLQLLGGPHYRHTDGPDDVPVSLSPEPPVLSPGGRHAFDPQSDVYKMLQDYEEPASAPKQSGSFKYLQGILEAEDGGGPQELHRPHNTLGSTQAPSGPIRSIQVPSGPFRSLKVPSGPFRSIPVPSGPFRSIPVPSGPFRSLQVHPGPFSGSIVKARDKLYHPECFVCDDCGANLKQRGYFFIEESLCCEAHAMARVQPPEGYDVVAVYPNSKVELV
ncbi:PDZ and LIM domain protein 4 [Liparis tanakae]|uniref:PDZ and LIM domain protein 4 n=1 Tax=Liparis tanakae TaxID=230148 RepID=A0A4Z2FSG7_9TELE|nr:PDZ and LIM domain protein 4 [Liparis tanakae]